MPSDAVRCGVGAGLHMQKSHFEIRLVEDRMALQPCAFAKERSGRRRRILLVEDEPFVREATCSILRNAGFEVLPAEDAREAMKVYEECGQSVDLVMTDMVLPGRTGQQLGQDLR